MFKKTTTFFIHFILLGMLLFACMLTPVSAQENKPTIDTSDQINNYKMQDKWFAIDKVQHFSYSCLISLGIQYVLVNKMEMDETAALPVSLGISFTAGITKEIQDSKSKNGFFSRKDLVANGLGIILSAIIILLPVN